MITPSVELKLQELKTNLLLLEAMNLSITCHIYSLVIKGVTDTEAWHWHWLKASALCVWAAYCSEVVVRSLAGQSNLRSIQKFPRYSITDLMAVKRLPAAQTETQTLEDSVKELQDAYHTALTDPSQMIRSGESIYFQPMSVNKCSSASLLTSQDADGCWQTFSEFTLRFWCGTEELWSWTGVFDPSGPRMGQIFMDEHLCQYEVGVFYAPW